MVSSVFDPLLQLSEQIDILIFHLEHPFSHLLHFIPQCPQFVVHLHMPWVQNCRLEAERGKANA